MDSPERQAVRRALDALKPFLEAFLTQHDCRIEPSVRGRGTAGPDIQALLKSCVVNWDATIQSLLPRVARSYVHELLDIRNRWAHEEPFSASEAARAVDTARVFGALLGAPLMAVPIVATATPTKPRVVKRSPSQRDVMRRIFVAVNGDAEQAAREYAAAERRGEVARKSDKHGIDAETYARALLSDGTKKGWLALRDD